MGNLKKKHSMVAHVTKFKQLQVDNICHKQSQMVLYVV
jgi:hypothetical protein